MLEGITLMIHRRYALESFFTNLGVDEFFELVRQ